MKPKYVFNYTDVAQILLAYHNHLTEDQNKRFNELTGASILEVMNYGPEYQEPEDVKEYMSKFLADLLIEKYNFTDDWGLGEPLSSKLRDCIDDTPVNIHKTNTTVLSEILQKSKKLGECR